MEKYIEEYNAFMDNYSKGTTSGEDVGIVIARLAQYYCEANNKLSSASKIYNKRYATVIEGVEDNLKPITAAKAKVLIDASQESEIFGEAKTRLENIEQLINALKYLQKGILNEFSHVGSM
jgi:hypothetical protein